MLKVKDGYLEPQDPLARLFAWARALIPGPPSLSDPPDGSYLVKAVELPEGLILGIQPKMGRVKQVRLTPARCTRIYARLSAVAKKRAQLDGRDDIGPGHYMSQAINPDYETLYKGGPPEGVRVSHLAPTSCSYLEPGWHRVVCLARLQDGSGILTAHVVGECPWKKKRR